MIVAIYLYETPHFLTVNHVNAVTQVARPAKERKDRDKKKEVNYKTKVKKMDTRSQTDYIDYTSEETHVNFRV